MSRDNSSQIFCLCLRTTALLHPDLHIEKQFYCHRELLSRHFHRIIYSAKIHKNTKLCCKPCSATRPAMYHKLAARRVYSITMSPLLLGIRTIFLTFTLSEVFPEQMEALSALNTLIRIAFYFYGNLPWDSDQHLDD